MAVIRLFVVLICVSALTPHKVHADDDSPGTLIVAGGGALPDRIFDRFVEFAGGEKARILIIPQASEKADAGERGKSIFANRPHQKLEVLDLGNRETALKQIEQSTGIWISGGAQNLLMKRLRDVDGAVEGIRSAHRKGVVVAGSSAGAAVMSDIMIAGDTLPLDRGLALWPEVVVDQHFAARKRMQRSLDAISKHPDKVGVGIDENTAVLVHPDGKLEVLGERGVTVIDARNSKKDNAPLALQNIRVDRYRESSPGFRITMNALGVNLPPPIAIVVHGGAGSVDEEWLTEERKKQHFEALEKAVSAGHAILESGGSSLDAVEAAIVILEDSPLFNAGKGAVFTRAETNELDASIMDGRTRDAGAVGGVTTIKNPIVAARAVMEETPHVMLAGEGADLFAQKNGLEIVDPDYFRTDRRLRQMREKLEKEKKAGQKRDQAGRPGPHMDYLGTVGAVALDRKGNIAAGTSTGGLTGKQFGRIGDSPIIGAGTYARNGVGGISCTGHGEYFIRYAVAHDIVARAEYGPVSLDAAAAEVIEGVLKKAGGGGGVIGIAPDGSVIMRANTESMWRSWRDGSGIQGTALMAKEEAAAR
ncbi:MAG: cyanophycinase [Verrucomicrobiales bacterium]|nr:cyanophycinase [Verrucomicrobiales bacterium]